MSSSSFITEIEEIIDQPLNQSSVSMDQQLSIHDIKLIKDNKLITNYNNINSLQNSQNNNNITFSPIDGIPYIQIPMRFCKNIHILLHRNVDLSSHID